MNAICNLIKNTLDNHLRNYNINLFKMNLVGNSTKPYSIKYLVKYQAVEFSIELEYINNQIEFNFSCDACYSGSTFIEIADFLKFIKSLPTQNLLKQIQFALKK